VIILVLNEFGVWLGFGKIVYSLGGVVKKTEVAVKNISEVSDFLRRET